MQLYLSKDSSWHSVRPAPHLHAKTS